MKQYLTVPVPYRHTAKALKPEQVAKYLGEVINQHAAQGWALHSMNLVQVDPMGGVVRSVVAGISDAQGTGDGSSLHYILIFEADRA
jgi:hypothetical protein